MTPIHDREERDDQHAYRRLADQGVAPVDVTARRLLEQAVEAAEESGENAFGFFPWPQQQRGERRRRGSAR